MPKKLTDNEVRNKIKELTNDEFIWVSGDYKSAKQKINILHKKCNTISNISLDYIRERGINCCHYCNQILVDKRKRITNEEYQKQFYNLYSKNEYELLDTYIDDKTKLKVLCHKCNKIFLNRPNDAKNGYMCPNCNLSKGEKAISKWLDNNNYNYETQYKFDDLIYKKHLHFDFKVNLENNSFILIEFDGEQHYNKKRCFHNDIDRYQEQLKRDKLKDQYCKDHNYKLFRIPYSNLKNIDIILNEIFSNME